jgi:hypothetical protein
MTLQHFLLHVSVGPHAVEEVFLGNQPPGVLHQISQNSECLRLQQKASFFAALRVAPPTLIDRVQSKWREFRRASADTIVVPKLQGAAA